MNFADSFPNKQLMQALGDDITYKRGMKTFNLKAIVERNVQNVGEQGVVIERRHEIEFLKVDIEPLTPQRDDIILNGKDKFFVDAVIADDGTFIKVTARNG